MGLFSRAPSSYLGVDIGADGIKIVELKKNKNRPQLWTYGIARERMDVHPSTPHGPVVDHNQVPQPGQDKGGIIDESTQARQAQIDRYAELLKTVVKESRATSTAATASLPVSYIFHTVLTLPKVDKDELSHIVEAEVRKFLPRPVEEMQIASQIMPQSEEEKRQKYMRVLVTAAPKFLITFYTSIFQKAGLKLQELETEAFALERSLVGKDKTTSMIVDIGAERTNFFIIDQGFPMTHRSLQVGGNAFDRVMSEALDIDQDFVSQIKKDSSQLPKGALRSSLFDDVISAMIKEIEYNFDVFLRQLGNEGKRPEKIILTGGSCMFPIIQERIQEAFPMKVFVGDPWARVVYQQKLKSVLDSIGPRMSVAIGLALRNIVT